MICIFPKAIHKRKWLIEIIIDHAHNIIGHFRQFKTAQYIRRYFWWPSMSHDIELYCRTCGICVTTNDANSKPAGLLHSLLILDRPWQSIGMDFMGPLLKLNNFNYLLVVIDQLTSQIHLVPTTTTVTARGIMWLILKEVVRLHGILEFIVSDRDTKFTSIFWKELHRLMGSKFLMSTVFLSGDDLFSTPKTSQSSSNSNLGHLRYSSDSDHLRVPEMLQSTSISKPLPAVPNTTMCSFYSDPSSNTTSEGCSETSASSEGNLGTSSDSTLSDPNSTLTFFRDSLIL